MGNPVSTKIDASPTKDFFISMLVKDIELIRAIIDLVDNSLDGARSIRSDGDYTGLAVHIEATEDHFKVSDNCGGISVETARNYAFRFGRPDKADFKPHSIGLFGVGMKRAIFKLGGKFRVESTTRSSHWLVEEDVEAWKNKKEWEFDFKALEENLPEVPWEQCGTIIVITPLHRSVSEDFGLGNFQARLAKELEEAHLNSLGRGMVITLNGVNLTARPALLLHSDEIKPAYYKTSFQEGDRSRVEVEMYAGISNPDPSSAGWYVFCNGRLVLKADQSIVTGWGEGAGKTIPKYHNNFARFRGYAFFDSEDARLLPWNTTKSGVDTDLPMFRAIRLEMVKLMRPVIDVLNRLGDERGSEMGEKPLETAISAARPAKLTDVTFHSTFLAPTPAPMRQPDRTGRVRYIKPLEEINRVMKTLKVRTHKEVGERTFEYFYERECD